MRGSMFNIENEVAPVSIRLYCDEIKPYRNAVGEQWMYMGLLALPDEKYRAALACLNEARDQIGYDREVHFRKLNNYSYAPTYGEKTLLAKKWVESVMWDREKIFHFHLLGLHLDNLQQRAFGESGREQKRNTYNRFFRSALAYSIKAFFGRRNVVISNIFHDNSNELEQDEWFDWHAIWRLDAAEKDLTFQTKKVEFINSDHHKEPEFSNDSHFIQLCDVLMGAFTQVLDARNTKDGCTEVGKCILPLAERLVDERRVRNPNSRYCYFKRVSLSFFPSRKLTLQELSQRSLQPTLRKRSGFYIARRLLMAERESGQRSLFE